MAQYLADLISVTGHQLNGKSIEGSTLVNRLIEERVTLERIRPLEEKLKYKIDKLTKIAHGNIDKNDPLQIKPNVDNLDLSGKEKIHRLKLRKIKTTVMMTMKKMRKNKKLNRNQKLDCTEHRENKWFTMMVKIEFLERKKQRHTNENVQSRGILAHGCLSTISFLIFKFGYAGNLE